MIFFTKKMNQTKEHTFVSSLCVRWIHHPEQCYSTQLYGIKAPNEHKRIQKRDNWRWRLRKQKLTGMRFSLQTTLDIRIILKLITIFFIKESLKPKLKEKWKRSEPHLWFSDTPLLLQSSLRSLCDQYSAKRKEKKVGKLNMGLYIDTLLFLLGLYIVWAYLDKILQYFLNKTNKDSKKRKKKDLA